MLCLVLVFFGALSLSHACRSVNFPETQRVVVFFLLCCALGEVVICLWWVIVGNVVVFGLLYKIATPLRCFDV